MSTGPTGPTGPSGQPDAPDVPAPKTPGLDPEVYSYLLAHGSPVDPVLTELAAQTRRLVPEQARMLISPEQGGLLTLLTRLGQVRLAVELGTFTGYSALCIARGLPPDGRLVCFDNSPQWVDIGRPYWTAAGVEDRIEVRIGDAAQGLAELPVGADIGFAFVDAHKPDYPRYLQLLLERLAPDGVIAVDNTLWGGAVLADSPESSPDTRIIAEFNDELARDPRLTVVQLAVGDGLTLVQQRG